MSIDGNGAGAAHHHRLARYGGLAAVLVIAAAIRLPGALTAPVWLDEAWGIVECRGSISDLYQYLLHHESAHPPGYFVFLFLLIKCTGGHALVGRLASLAFGLATIVFCYLFTARLGRASGGLFAASFLAVSPLHLWYSQRVRMYSLEVLLAVAASYYLLRAVEEPGTRWRGNRNLFLYGFCIAAAVYVDYFGWLVVAAHCAWLGWQSRRGLAVGRFIKVFIFLLVVYLPWLPVFLRVLTQMPLAAPQFEPTLGFWSELVAAMLPVARLQGWLGICAASGMVGLVLVGLVRGRRTTQGRPLVLLAMLIAVPLASVPFLPMVSSRSLLIVLPWIGSALALALPASAPRRWPVLLLLLTLQAIGHWGYPRWYSEQATSGRALEPWDQVVRILTAAATPTSPVLLLAQHQEEPTNGLPLRYYLPELRYRDIVAVAQVRRRVRESGPSVLVVRRANVGDWPSLIDELDATCRYQVLFRSSHLSVFLCEAVLPQSLGQGIVFEELVIASPGDHHDEYLQDVRIVRREQGYLLWSRIYGRSLTDRDNDSVRNPYVRIVDCADRRPIAELPLHRGWVGSGSGVWAPLQSSMRLPRLPARYTVWIGYAYYRDESHPPGGGPAQRMIGQKSCESRSSTHLR